jgi:hypothetical protein
MKWMAYPRRPCGEVFLGEACHIRPWWKWHSPRKTSRGTARTSWTPAPGGGAKELSRFRACMSSRLPVIPDAGMPRVPPMPSLYGSSSPQLCEPGTILGTTHHPQRVRHITPGQRAAVRLRGDRPVRTQQRNSLAGECLPHAPVLHERVVERQPRGQHMVR